MYYDTIDSPIGLIEIAGSADAITSVAFVAARRARVEASPLVREAARQLADYFAGTRRTFDLPLAPPGTEFQQQVWRQLLAIPYGHLASYGAIAAAIGRPEAVRAVGAANGQNPIAIIVPCHRIVGSDGTLTGYGGGLWRKEWLLRHEGSLLL